MNMSCSKSVLALGFSVGVLLLSSACGNSPKTANVAGSWFWAENNLTVSPPVITKLHANLSQTGVTVTGSKIVPGGSCAITATIKGGQLQGHDWRAMRSNLRRQCLHQGYVGRLDQRRHSADADRLRHARPYLKPQIPWPGGSPARSL